MKKDKINLTGATMRQTRIESLCLLICTLFTTIFLASCTSNPQEPATTTVFLAEEACIKTGCNNCDFITCDYVPKGQTFEEACGKNFRKGWQCVEEIKR